MRSRKNSRKNCEYLRFSICTLCMENIKSKNKGCSEAMCDHLLNSEKELQSLISLQKADAVKGERERIVKIMKNMNIERIVKLTLSIDVNDDMISRTDVFNSAKVMRDEIIAKIRGGISNV